jgi:glutathione-regulated potassium-efflux system ancillary protein KefC
MVGAVVTRLATVAPHIIWMLDRSGHGELLPLSGVFLAFAGGELFE